MNSSAEEVPSNKSRKRQRNETMWKRNKEKRQRYVHYLTTTTLTNLYLNLLLHKLCLITTTI